MKNKIKRKAMEITKLYFFRRKWRNENKHNFTNAKNIFDSNQVKVGQYTYGDILAENFKRNDVNLTIGNYCSIGPNVTFLLAGEHDYKNISTYPFKRKILKGDIESISKGDIIVKDDVWIGFGSVILSGVTIGQGAVIGAGSIVAKDIPPYSIYVGNSVIKYRFSEKIINKLLQIDFNKLNENDIKANIDFLYTNCTDENIDEIINKVFGDKNE